MPARASAMDHKEYLQTPHWADVRRAALWVAGYRCRTCGSSRELEVHHVDYSALGREGPDDVVVLCRTCHEAVSQALGAGEGGAYVREDTGRERTSTRS